MFRQLLPVSKRFFSTVITSKSPTYIVSQKLKFGHALSMEDYKWVGQSHQNVFFAMHASVTSDQKNRLAKLIDLEKEDFNSIQSILKLISKFPDNLDFNYCHTSVGETIDNKLIDLLNKEVLRQGFAVMLEPMAKDIPYHIQKKIFTNWDINNCKDPVQLGVYYLALYTSFHKSGAQYPIFALSTTMQKTQSIFLRFVILSANTKKKWERRIYYFHFIAYLNALLSKGILIRCNAKKRLL